MVKFSEGLPLFRSKTVLALTAIALKYRAPAHAASGSQARSAAGIHDRFRGAHVFRHNTESSIIRRVWDDASASPSRTIEASPCWLGIIRSRPCAPRPAARCAASAVRFQFLGESLDVGCLEALHALAVDQRVQRVPSRRRTVEMLTPSTHSINVSVSRQRLASDSDIATVLFVITRASYEGELRRLAEPMITSSYARR
jgi:hypothetical protein